MTKIASFALAAGLFGCLTVLPGALRAQSSPAAANVEAAPAEETKVAPNETEILASEGATFASKDRIAVFKGDVRVRDPRFTLACDTLTVYLSKNAGGEADSPSPSPAPTPAALAADGKDKSPADRGSGIDHALAEGHVIIIQKRAATKPGEEEKLSIGHSDTAEFDNKTGDMTLRGMPRIEQNGNTHEALSRSTYMILHKDNSLETHGPSRTTITQRAKATESPAKSGASPASSARPTH